MPDLPLALFAGILTIAAPCTLPVLPILLGASIGQRTGARPALIAAGFVASFAFVALALNARGKCPTLRSGSVAHGRPSSADNFRRADDMAGSIQRAYGSS